MFLARVFAALVALIFLASCQVSETVPAVNEQTSSRERISPSPQNVSFQWFEQTIELTWQDIGNNENYYEVRYRADNATWSNSLYTEADATGITLFDIPVQTQQVAVKLRSGNSFGESAWTLLSIENPNASVHEKPKLEPEAAIAQLITPVAGSVVNAGQPLSLQFSSAPEMWIDIGSSPRAHDLVSMAIAGDRYEIAHVPAQWSDLYITLWSGNQGLWSFSEYHFEINPAEHANPESILGISGRAQQRPMFTSEPGKPMYWPLDNDVQGAQLYAGRDNGEGIDLVVVAEGYHAGQLNQFLVDAQQLIDTAFDFHPLNKHLPAWNIHFLALPSNQSGADAASNEFSTVDTRYDASYYCNGTERLLCINERKVKREVAQYVPQYDEILVLVNSPKFGGGAYQGLASVSLASAAVNLLRHELGHSFAGLVDEYDYGLHSPPALEPNAANATLESDPTKVKWRHWIAQPDQAQLNQGEGIGLWEGAVYHAYGVYRPNKNSMMKSLGQAFGEVNSEAWALAVYDYIQPVTNSLPAQGDVELTLGQKQWFALDALYSDQEMDVVWQLDGQALAAFDESKYYYQFNAEQTGEYQLTATITDATGVIRHGLEKTQQRLTWSIRVN